MEGEGGNQLSAVSAHSGFGTQQHLPGKKIAQKERVSWRIAHKNTWRTSRKEARRFGLLLRARRGESRNVEVRIIHREASLPSRHSRVCPGRSPNLRTDRGERVAAASLCLSKSWTREAAGAGGAVCTERPRSCLAAGGGREPSACVAPRESVNKALSAKEKKKLSLSLSLTHPTTPHPAPPSDIRQIHDSFHFFSFSLSETNRVPLNKDC